MRSLGMVVLAGVVVLGCDRSDYDYETPPSSVQDYAVSGLLPASARRIHVRHDSDTGEAWGRFEFDPATFPADLPGLPRLASPADARPPYRGPGRWTPWWDADVVAAALAGKDPRLVLYRAPLYRWRFESVLLFDLRTGVGYLWHAPL